MISLQKMVIPYPPPRFGALLFVGCLCLAIPNTLPAQTKLPQGSNEAAGTGPAAGPRIQFEVVVTDATGKPVLGLTQRDFSVLDNKQPRQIVFFQSPRGAVEGPGKVILATGGSPADRSPVEVIVVIDSVNTDPMTIANEQEQLAELFRQRRFETAISLAVFTPSGLQMAHGSHDGMELSAQLDGARNLLQRVNPSQGTYSARDRFQVSLHVLGQIVELESRRPGKKLVIWLGPGWPILSNGRRLTRGEQENLFEGIVLMSDGLRQAGITLYSVSPLEETLRRGAKPYYMQFLKPVKRPGQSQPGALSVQVLAAQSGGLVLDSASDMAGRLRDCLLDAQSFYTLSFDAPAGEQPNQYHALDVGIAKPGLYTRTRAGYYSYR